MNSNLILRSANSPFGDVTKGSALTLTELDNNLLYLKGINILTGNTANNSLILTKINGEEIIIDNVGGSASAFSSVTYTEMLSLIATSGLTTNCMYEITDATQTNGGSGSVIALAISTNELSSDVIWKRPTNRKSFGVIDITNIDSADTNITVYVNGVQISSPISYDKSVEGTVTDLAGAIDFYGLYHGASVLTNTTHKFLIIEALTSGTNDNGASVLITSDLGTISANYYPFVGGQESVTQILNATYDVNLDHIIEAYDPINSVKVTSKIGVVGNSIYLFPWGVSTITLSEFKYFDAELENFFIGDTTFLGCSFEGITFTNFLSYGNNFGGNKLTTIAFNNTTFLNNTFSYINGTTLSINGAYWSDNYIVDMETRGTNFNNSSIVESSMVANRFINDNFYGSSINMTLFGEFNLIDSEFVDSSWDNVEIANTNANTLSFNNSTIQSTHFNLLTILNLEFNDSYVIQFTLRESELTDCFFSNLSAYTTTLSNSFLNNTSLVGTVQTFSLTNSDLFNCTISTNTDFINVEIDSSDLKDFNVSNNSEFTNITIYNANLNDFTLINSSVNNTSFNYSSFFYTSIDNSALNFLSIQYANIINAVLNNSTFNTSVFDNSKLTNLSLSNVNWNNVGFQSNSGINIILDNSTILNGGVVYSTLNYLYASYVNLTGSSLSTLTCYNFNIDYLTANNLILAGKIINYSELSNQTLNDVTVSAEINNRLYNLNITKSLNGTLENGADGSQIKMFVLPIKTVITQVMLDYNLTSSGNGNLACGLQTIPSGIFVDSLTTGTNYMTTLSGNNIIIPKTSVQEFLILTPSGVNLTAGSIGVQISGIFGV